MNQERPRCVDCPTWQGCDIIRAALASMFEETAPDTGCDQAVAADARAATLASAANVSNDCPYIMAGFEES
ncbi:MAG TPA: hypothetical protein VMB52_02335 [Verrucomicrobiae bacterium]|nr:hypothetical protein [Verrucomicrobiae bacterium]